MNCEGCKYGKKMSASDLKNMFNGTVTDFNGAWECLRHENNWVNGECMDREEIEVE